MPVNADAAANLAPVIDPSDLVLRAELVARLGKSRRAATRLEESGELTPIPDARGRVSYLRAEVETAVAKHARPNRPAPASVLDPVAARVAALDAELAKVTELRLALERSVLILTAADLQVIARVVGKPLTHPEVMWTLTVGLKKLAPILAAERAAAAPPEV